MLNIQVMPLGAYQTNCYILWDDAREDCVVIDPGYEPETVLRKAKALGKSIAAILLTHGHFDHVGAVREIVDETNCLVVIHEKELSLPESFTAGPLYYTDTYDEGSTIFTCGMAFRILHTPGHTPGSVCILCENHMFSGDTLFQDSCGRTDLPGGDWKEIRKSLRRLASLEKDYAVHPGHGPSTTLAEEKQYNLYMQ